MYNLFMPKTTDFNAITLEIKRLARDLGFNQVGITDTELTQANMRLEQWLAKGYHGDMSFMSRHKALRANPSQLVPGAKTAIMVRLDYLPPKLNLLKLLKNPFKAIVSCYAQGRDYHRLVRKRLQMLAEQIQALVGEYHYRAFTDSAPVLEKPLAEKAGLGWIGKHTNLINAKAGSWFFLGCLYTDLPLTVDAPASSHCGSCQRCIDVCPTQAIVAPYQLDANRCISYLTIELKGSIPEPLRPLIGNRVYGCDDCQFVCPWNKFAKATTETEFHPRHGLDDSELLTLFAWNEDEFNNRLAGSAIRRIGHARWLRNLAVGLGNAPYDPRIVSALNAKRDHPAALVREHVAWALAQQLAKA